MKVLAVVGATASGKSALALRLAERFGGEILSCDSMQVYRGMDIGTAKPKREELARVPHHLIDIADPREPFSAADYAAAANIALREVAGRSRLPVFCGGTGLYLSAVLGGRHRNAPGADPALRERLLAEAEREGGAEELYRRLSACDPASAAAIHPHNLRRVIRALEIFETTGRTKSELDAESRKAPSPYDCLFLGIDFPSRDLLRERIDRRVDEMAAAGLEQEVRRLAAAGALDPETTAGMAIGYRQFFPYLEGRISLPDVFAEIRTATRQYAKRQMTWFRAMPEIHWLNGAGDPLGEATALTERFLNTAQPERDSHDSN